MATEEIKGILNEVAETGKEVVETAKERFRNPLIGSFIISTIILLWEPISVLILSKKDIEERIVYIKNNFQYEWYYFLIPLAATIIYVLIVPFVKWGFDLLLNIPNRGISENNRRQKNLEYVAEMQNRDERNRILNRKNIDDKIENLTKELKSRENEIELLNKKNSSMQDELAKRLQREEGLENENKELKVNFKLLLNDLKSLKEGLDIDPQLKYSSLKKEYG